MNRFEHTSPSPIKYVARFLPIVFFIFLLVIFIKGIITVSDTTLAKQKESLETAITHDIAQCYAVEGSYPKTLDYLVQHYGLTYDNDAFLVIYNYYGANLYPDVDVIFKTGKKLN